MPDELLERLRHFHDDYFPAVQGQFQSLMQEGQHPSILFIGCSDSRLVPYLLTGTGPGEVFMVRNVGAFVPPHDGSAGYHGTAAAIEFAVLKLDVARCTRSRHRTPPTSLPGSSWAAKPRCRCR
jgi:carbonic anhydrase